jgi:hypothetical protein
MTLRHDRRITRRDEADDVRLQQAIGGNARKLIAIFNLLRARDGLSALRQGTAYATLHECRFSQFGYVRV